MKPVFFAVLLMFPVVGLAAGSGKYKISDYYGVWKGSVVEGPVKGKDHDQYEVVIEIAPGKYTISYPSLKCGGELLFQGNTGRHFHFRDKLEYGKDQCAFGGYTELLMVSTSKAAFQWFDSSGVLRAKGMLKRYSRTLAL